MNFESFRSRISVLVLAAVALGGVVMAQGGQKPGGGGGGPMLIDFTAVGADGKPIETLAPADVTIRIGGKARTITGLELKKVSASAAPAAAAGAPAAAKAAGDITAPFSTNEVSAAPAAPAPSAGVNRSVLIVVDTESLPAAAESGFKAAISTLLEGLAPGDRVALATAPRDTAQIGFGPVARVREALAAVRGQRSPSATSYDALCRTSQTLALLSSMIQPLGANSTPTAVVVVAGSLTVSGRTDGTNGTCEVVAGDYRRVVDAAAESRANMFIVQGDSGAMGRDNGLEQLAGDSGAGAVMRVTGEGIAPRVLASVSNYWVATLAPDPSDRPGQAQRLEVKAVKEGVTIGARAMAAPSRVAMAGPAAAAAAKPGNASINDMLSSQAAYTDLQLRGSAIVQRGAGDQMNVIIMAEPVDTSVKINSMKVGFFDASNKGRMVEPKQMATFPISLPMALAPGQYRVRIAATDSTGKSGAVDVPVTTTLVTAGPLKLSQLMVGAPQGDNGLRPQLTFSNEPEIRVFLEIYGQLSAGLSAKFEIAKSDTGPAVETFQAAGGAPGNEPDKFAVFGKIPIDKLAPGDYVVRAVVQLEGQPEGKSIRTFRKIAK